MDFEQNSGIEPIPEQVQQTWPVQKAKKRSGWRIFWGIVLVLSVVANILLFLALVGVAVVLATGQRGIFTEEVIQAGHRTNKVVIITVQDLIDGEQAQDVYRQLKMARKDQRVKGLIIRINSPGGLVSASDQIYNEISRYRQKTDKPVVAFMQGIAASGGYYASVACDKIVAEPTAITGSIGVMMGHFVLQDLLENKLGILPVIVKSGEKKDWPSPFQPFTDQQRQYIEDKLINPAYERFVQLVADGRKELELEDVRRLADGSIYGADEALAEKLIDKVGYLDDAIELISSLAGIEKAHVVEYRKPFSLTDILTSANNSFLKINKAALYELSTPQLMYLWSMY
jgi:protease-4